MNIYCFSTLSFAKLQFKSVINKAFHKHGVASFTDAWIETNNNNIPVVKGESHLLQMRGLKLLSITCRYTFISVASFTDAWIETLILISASSFEWSHLLQMRGLKQMHGRTNRIQSKSHLLQMRGLKLHVELKDKGDIVSHLLQMRGLKHFDCTAQLPISRSHLLQMRGLKPEQVVIINI